MLFETYFHLARKAIHHNREPFIELNTYDSRRREFIAQRTRLPGNSGAIYFPYEREKLYQDYEGRLE